METFMPWISALWLSGTALAVSYVVWTKSEWDKFGRCCSIFGVVISMGLTAFLVAAPHDIARNTAFAQQLCAAPTPAQESGK